MKKLLAFLLIFTLIFTLAACAGEDESKEESSKSASSSTASSKDESSKEESSKEESSEEESSEEETDPLPEYIGNWVTFDASITYGNKADSAKSIKLTKIDAAPVEGDIVLFTNAYGKTIAAEGETYADYAILVVEYNKTLFKNLKKEIIAVDSDTDKSQIAIPEDGFVIAVHEKQKTYVTRLSTIKDTDIIYVAGYKTKELTWDLNKLDKTVTVDGDLADWSASKYRIERITTTNTNWDYSQFKDVDNTRSADIYIAYDDNNLYIGIEITSENCVWLPDINDSNKSGMWELESIQMNVMNISPDDEKVLENFDGNKTGNLGDNLLVKDGNVRQYGFSGADDGKSYAIVFFGANTEFTGKVAVVRDDEKSLTKYEISIPWTELGIEDINSQEQIGLSFSVNSSEEKGGENWQNIRMRDTGGIIGWNDFSKMALVNIKD